MPDQYGDVWADVYDEWHRFLDPAPAVDFLASVGAGTALEVGVGTGRVAVPLAARGVDVHGIDTSERMLAKAREKSDAVRVTIADAAAFDLGERFGLAYCAFNTLFSLPSQDAQLACFERVAAHLVPGGLFVVEAFVPDPARYSRGQSVSVVHVEPDQARLTATVHDATTQTLRSQLIVLGEFGLRLLPIYQRYAWPAELDLMARVAGLSLRDRFGGWSREPFTGSSTNHISVYAKP